jgi:hypothetical protein
MCLRSVRRIRLNDLRYILCPAAQPMLKIEFETISMTLPLLFMFDMECPRVPTVKRVLPFTPLGPCVIYDKGNEGVDDRSIGRSIHRRSFRFSSMPRYCDWSTGRGFERASMPGKGKRGTCWLRAHGSSSITRGRMEFVTTYLTLYAHPPDH